jgi:hypothetical protein
VALLYDNEPESMAKNGLKMTRGMTLLYDNESESMAKDDLGMTKLARI